MEKPRVWTVQVAAPLDFFDRATVPVIKWLEQGGNWNEFLEAVAAYMACPDSDGHLRQPPVVAYDARHDSHYFIFKEENNGTSYVVSSFGDVPVDATVGEPFTWPKETPA